MQREWVQHKMSRIISIQHARDQISSQLKASPGGFIFNALISFVLIYHILFSNNDIFVFFATIEIPILPIFK